MKMKNEKAMSQSLDLLPVKKIRESLKNQTGFNNFGKVQRVVGLLIEGQMSNAQVGTTCNVNLKATGETITAEVVGLSEKKIFAMPLGETHGIQTGDMIQPHRSNATILVGDECLGRVINGLGEPIDGKGPIAYDTEMPLYAVPVNPLKRRSINEPLVLGVRSIDGLITIGKGQRIGINAGSGVGKSVLMSMMCTHTDADVNVIALIGERGREVTDFIEKILVGEKRKKTIVVASTSDRSPIERMRGAFVATAISEYFCNKGKNVLLMLDSLTRFAMAQREVGLSAGEPPTTKGYPPSVFARMPKLLERAGSFQGKGSITGIYTVLADGDDMNDPIVDCARSILDGHIVLSRQLAAANHYPAIDVLNSLSRVMTDIASESQKEAAGKFRELLATYKEAEDLINIGAYVDGSNPRIDKAKAKIGLLMNFLRQKPKDGESFASTVNKLQSLVQ